MPSGKNERSALFNLKKKSPAKNQLSLFPEKEKPIILEDLSWMTKKQIYGGILPCSPEEKFCSRLVKLLTADTKK